MEKEVNDFLKNNNIKYKVYTHKPVFTVKDSKTHCKDIPGFRCKNLFLKSEDKFYLVILNGDKRLDIRGLAKMLKVRDLNFGSEEQLMKYLHLTPGSVSPLGLMNDTEKKVIPIVDQEAWDARSINFHPNINTETISVNKKYFNSLMKKFNAKILKLPTLD
ncbi:MAG: prolyl-tRNA synthetase associated domain-containing protein [Nanoarchaeota archaeon]